MAMTGRFANVYQNGQSFKFGVNHKDVDLGLKNLEEQFYKIDTDRSGWEGTIDVEEIKSAIESCV